MRRLMLAAAAGSAALLAALPASAAPVTALGAVVPFATTLPPPEPRNARPKRPPGVVTPGALVATP